MAGNTQHVAGPHGNRWRMTVWGVAACMLLLPFVAMQFTREVNWDGADFAVFGAMLLVACGTHELAARMTGNGMYRAAVGVAVVAAFLLFWMNLAVGLIGSEDNPANLMYDGVLAVGIVGAIVARFQPRGMALVLVAMALAQVLAALIAGVLTRWSVPLQIVILNGGFAALWLLSAWLFRRAADERSAMAMP